MKILKLLFAFLVISNCIKAQSVVLRDSTLVKYYRIINDAEMNIVNNNLEQADKLYSEAYNLRKNVPVNDLYNRMTLLLKMSKKKEAYDNYSKLKCLNFDFGSTFFETNFPSNFKSEGNLKCDQKFDLAYKKQLDSLMEIDQHYRLLSKGDYYKFQKEMSNGDSIASTGLLKLLQTKGFPDEYDIGVDTRGEFQKFYAIILHQLATNTISKQQVNFTKEIDIALNKGKITPNNAAFLVDLLNKDRLFTSRHFDINEFTLTDDKSNLSQKEQVAAKTVVKDCCYVTYGFFPEKRTNEINDLMKKLNENRKNVGLCSIDDMIKKNVYQLNNPDFQFVVFNINGIASKNKTGLEEFKKHFFKIK